MATATKKRPTLTADFETTTQPDKNGFVKVWAWGISDIKHTDIFKWGRDIHSFFEFCESLKNGLLYFHNLKFDGGYIIDYLLRHNYKWIADSKERKTRTFTTLITDTGQFYSIKVYFSVHGKNSIYVEFVDSLKILNMSVRQVAKAFNLSMSKGDIDYTRHNIDGVEITEKEIDYLRRDVQIMARALAVMHDRGFYKMTIGSCALNDYRSNFTKKEWDVMFPQLTIEQDSEIRKAYKGGFTFCNPEHQAEEIGRGIVLDVNSLYPWVMHDCPMPYGKPVKFTGEYQYFKEYPLYTQSLRCMFDLKDGYLPTIQLKNNLAFMPTQYLTTSRDKDGQQQLVELTLTNVDLKLFFEHYEVYNIQYIGGYMFKSATNLFAEWVDYWADVKIQAAKEKNIGQRTIAKLIMNNLYGKFATNPFKASKYPYLDNEKNIVRYKDVEYELCDDNGNPVYYPDGTPKTTNKKVEKGLYIPVGCFVTAWARDKTIRTSQKIHSDSLKKYGISRYLYSDTDSIHMTGFNLPENVDIDDFKLGAWKHESSFERAKFLRAKRYIEDEIIMRDDNKLLKNGYGDYITKYKITCAGMPLNCHNQVTWENFRNGATFSGKLTPHTVQGGVILSEIEYTMQI